MDNSDAETNSESSVMDLPFSYCGLLDDVVARYDPSYLAQDLFNRILVKSLFFGGGLYINDGYLFMHAAAREQMKNEKSVLCQMLEYGFVKIFTREDSLSGLQKLVDKSDVPSHVEFRESPDWDVLRDRWGEICEKAWNGNHVIPWGKPRNHKIQSKLYERVLNSDPADLGLSCNEKVLKRLSGLLFPEGEEDGGDLNPNAGAARTKFEEASTIAVQEAGCSEEAGQQVMRELMRLANESYHYAFGASLSWQHGKPVAVDTTISPAFDELIRRSNIDYRKFMSFPTFGIPISVNLSDGEKLRPLMQRSHSAFKAKARFLENFISHHRVEEYSTEMWKQEVIEMTEGYAEEVSEIIEGVDPKSILSDSVEHQIALARSTTDSGLYHAAATPVPCVSAAVVKEDGGKVGDCIAKFSVPIEDRISSWRFTGREIVPQVSSLSFHRSVVEEIMDDDFLLNDLAVRTTEQQ